MALAPRQIPDTRNKARRCQNTKHSKVGVLQLQLQKKNFSLRDKCMCLEALDVCFQAAFRLQYTLDFRCFIRKPQPTVLNTHTHTHRSDAFRPWAHSAVLPAGREVGLYWAVYIACRKHNKLVGTGLPAARPACWIGTRSSAGQHASLNRDRLRFWWVSATL